MYTGNIVKIERDENPNSPTYGTEREIVELSEICQNWQCRMVEIERETSGGVTMVTYEDKNENAPTFGKTITIASTDTTAQYLEMYSRCEQLRYHEDYYGNSGYKVATNIDANPNSSTYQQVVENVRTLDLVNCEKPNTNPIEEIETHCKLIDYASGQKGTNGVEVVEVYDMNPYSTTYWEKLREYERQSEDCAAPETTPNVIKICDYCEVNQQGKNTGYHITKQKDINLFSPNYDDDFVELRVKDDILCKSEISILRGTGVPNSSFSASLDAQTITINIDANGNWEYEFLSNPKGNQFNQFVKANKENVYSISLSDVNTSELTHLSGIFYGLSSLTSFDFEGCDLSNINGIYSMFFGVSSIENIDMRGMFDKVQTIRDAFRDCTQAKRIDLSGWNTTYLTDAFSAFSGCSSLLEVDLSGWDLTNCSLSQYMFYRCDSLTTIYARGCNQATIDLLNELKPSYANLIY